ncbi:hypothetical protein DFQ27_004120 [Actinomortierella ambigua]|uniref:F-box protein n=1 Tax=Actinomortierella ambigua TaxID=1343610 RepID=A0A9P6Q3V0_9FUNG|nr:hypothetical protein DFQ27_004120 [Actinomortierella ambigua]
MNYLSYNPDCFGPESGLNFQWSTCGKRLPSWVGLHDTFAWAVCAHRLSEIRSLEISWRCLPLYRRRFDNMMSIRSLRILTLDIPRKRTYSWTPIQKEKIKLDLKDVSWFVRQWSAAYERLPQKGRAPVGIQLRLLAKEDEWWRDQPFKSALKTVYLQMPVSPTLDLITSSYSEWIRFVLAPESFDLARLRSIVDKEWKYYFGEPRPWPDQGKAKILQQCRSLQKLELRCEADEDANIFQWAVQERQGAADVAATSSSNSRGGKLPRQGRNGVVPLSELKLILTDVMSLWKDAIFAFGTTLESLTIREQKSVDGIDLCVFLDMPVLRHLSLWCRVIKATAAPFLSCPQLTEIYLQSARRMSNDHGRFGQWDLAKVQVLSLEGVVSHQFNQATLKKMPMLKTLIMSDVVDDMLDGYPFMWDRSSWGPFPRLKTLELSGTMTESFCWSMLKQCPALNDLLLDALDVHTTQEVEFPYLSQQLEFTFERPGSPLAVYPALRSLRLHGYSISDAVLFDQLPRVVPSLTSLALHSCTRLSPMKLRKLSSKFKFLKRLEYKEYESDPESSESSEYSE